VTIRAPESVGFGTTADHMGTGPLSAEIVPGDRSGGTNTSHTIVVAALQRLLAIVGSRAGVEAYEQAVVTDNVLGKGTTGSRLRTLRYLKELYLLRPDSVLFRALRDLWPDDPAGQPLLAGLCALSRDSVFRASVPAILHADPGDQITSSSLADVVERTFPSAYSDRTLAKIGRNTFSSWEQTGHLEAVARTEKVRCRAICTPACVAYALLLGHLEGLDGEALFDTVWARVLDQPRSHLVDLASVASQRLLIDFRNSGGVLDIGFSELLRPFEDQMA
jgi:hypothetical protein